MIASVLRKIFGSKNERELKRMRRMVDRINELGEAVAALDDAALAAKTAEFRGRLEQGASLDELLPEAFAVVREKAHRVLGMRHFDNQLISGLAQLEGKISVSTSG